MKVSSFTNIVRDDVYLLHNSLHNTMLKVYAKDYQKEIDQLIDGKFFEFDEKSDLHNVLKVQKMIVDDHTKELDLVNYYYRINAPHNLLVIMIVTRQCNFRCPYCYEEHENRVMSKEIYSLTKKAILELVKDRGYKSVSISLFGGEPTLEYDNICAFLKELRSEMPKRITLSGSITSNGYLLTPERFSNLVDLGIHHYQITLDGMASTHDTSRYLAGGQGTWQVIVDNLLAAQKLDKHFSVTIRSNFYKAMFDEADEWFEFVRKNFNGDPRFGVYFEAAKELSESSYKDDMYSVEEANKAASILMQKATEKGLQLRAFEHRLKAFQLPCYASSPDSLVVDYDGKLRKCTVQIDNNSLNYVGELSSGKIINYDEKLAWWTDYELNSKCKQCSIYPICHGRKCPVAYYDEAYCKVLLSQYYSTLRSFCNNTTSK